MPTERLKRTVTDLWWLLVLSASLVVIGTMAQISERIAETRWWRDFTGQTPFHSVQVLRVEIDGNEARIWGTLIKRRCEKSGALAYTRRADGPLRLAGFRSEELPGTPGSRPPTDVAQEFGPWVIISNLINPEWASFWVLHDCPEGPTFNQVFRVRWAETNRESDYAD